MIVEKCGKRAARPFVSKAIINGNESMKPMLKRRTMFASFGILAPEQYSTTDACINKQFIPYAINSNTVLKDHITLHILNDIIHAAAVLDIEGFPTFNFIDLKMRSPLCLLTLFSCHSGYFPLFLFNRSLPWQL